MKMYYACIETKIDSKPEVVIDAIAIHISNHLSIYRFGFDILSGVASSSENLDDDKLQHVDDLSANVLCTFA